jgi:hypothetical protein
MGKFTLCNYSSVIWQVDADDPSQTPTPVHKGGGNILSIAFAADKQFIMLTGPGVGRAIRRTLNPVLDTVIYEPPPSIHPSIVRLRNLPSGERVYFSARASLPYEPVVYDIYYLENGLPVHYTKIEADKLLIPDPCKPSEEWGAYVGDFAFGDGDKLYLSSGFYSGMKVGIFKIDGAGPDTVTGTVERIHLGDGTIEGLCFKSPDTLYFLRRAPNQTAVWKLNLTTLTESMVIDLSSAPALDNPYDLAEVGDGFAPIQYWFIFGLLHKWLHNLATWVLQLGLKIVFRSKSGSDVKR